MSVTTFSVTDPTSTNKQQIILILLTKCEI